MSDDNRNSRVASDNSAPVRRSPAPIARRASANPRASDSFSIASAARWREFFSSIVFAISTVHVAIDASSNPTITNLTTISALRNIAHTDKSRGLIAESAASIARGACAPGTASAHAQTVDDRTAEAVIENDRARCFMLLPMSE